MERRWPAEALDFETAVRGALARAGGIDLARRAEADPDVRAGVLRPLLEDSGLLGLDVRDGATEAAAAALAVQAAGEIVAPWPLAAQLALPRASRAELDAVLLRDGSAPRRAEHLDLFGSVAAVDVASGEARLLRADGPPAPMPLDPFGAPCALGAEIELDARAAIDTSVVLSAFWVLGALGHARDLAVEHARERRQFGRRIVDFGAIQWHLSDIALGHDGLGELAAFSLARLIDGRLAIADTLALHLTTLESARSVLEHAHQVLAAIGLCEEHDLTVITRHLQPALRRPCGATRVAGLLADEVARAGFDNLYPIPAVAEV